MANVFDEIKRLLLRGNVVDLIVAVVFGAALANIIQSIVHHIFVPLFSILFNTKEISNMKFEFRGITLNYGIVINQVFIFLLSSFVLIYVFIKPYNRFILKN
jgi:large conductance mechanosensitive channel